MGKTIMVSIGTMDLDDLERERRKNLVLENLNGKYKNIILMNPDFSGLRIIDITGYCTMDYLLDEDEWHNDTIDKLKELKYEI